MEPEKKECILAAAVKAFGRFGFKKASVDEIARDARVAKGTVYLACESKEDLYYQSLHGEMRAWVGEVSKLIDRRQKADVLLERVARGSFATLESHPLVRELFLGSVAGELPGWRERIEDLEALGRTNVEEILRLGIKQGVFRAGLDVEAVGRVLQDMQLAGYLLYARQGLDAERFERHMRAGIDVALNGLRTRSRGAAQAA